MFTFLFSIVALVAGYFVYGKFIEHVFGADSSRKTPAVNGFSASAAVKDGRMTFAAVNCTDRDIDVKACLPYDFEDAVLYLYTDGRIELDSEGYPVPLKTGLNGKSQKLRVPAGSFLLVSDMEIN